MKTSENSSSAARAREIARLTLAPGTGHTSRITLVLRPWRIHGTRQHNISSSAKGENETHRKVQSLRSAMGGKWPKGTYAFAQAALAAEKVDAGRKRKRDGGGSQRMHAERALRQGEVVVAGHGCIHAFLRVLPVCLKRPYASDGVLRAAPGFLPAAQHLRVCVCVCVHARVCRSECACVHRVNVCMCIIDPAHTAGIRQRTHTHTPRRRSRD